MAVAEQSSAPASAKATTDRCDRDRVDAVQAVAHVTQKVGD